jgi:hypothetical protein
LAPAITALIAAVSTVKPQPDAEPALYLPIFSSGLCEVAASISATRSSVAGTIGRLSDQNLSSK